MKKTLITPKPSQLDKSVLDAEAWVSGESTTPTGERMKRFTFDVPEKLHRRVKAGCATRGVDMADLMRDFLEKEFPE